MGFNVNPITVYHKSATATDDNQFRVENQDKTILSSINIHAYLFDLYYGNAGGQEGIIPANSVIWFDGTIRVSDFWFKNYTPGSNGKVVIEGIIKR